MTGFFRARIGAHRLLLAAALLAVLLTTSVLAALTAFSGSIGNASLRHTLQDREAASTALVITAQVPPAGAARADRAAKAGAGRAFDGLPVTLRKLTSSGPYALPRSLQAPAERQGDPDLTHFSALDRSRVRLVRGTWPTAGPEGPVQVAIPQESARRLGLTEGARLTVDDRLNDQPVRIVITAVYRAADLTDPYWQLDELGGRGVRTVVFTTYGPLLTDSAVLGSGRLSEGSVSWLATADFQRLTTGRTGALRAASQRGTKSLATDPAFPGGADVRTSLPTVLDRTERALLVSRSTLLIVAVQLVMLAGYALLLVSRLLSTERTGETELLRARGSSRGRLAWLATVEALLLAAPAAVAAPLFAGPLTRLLSDRSSFARLGLRLEGTATAQVWLVAAVTALACAVAVVAPALAAAGAVRLGRRRQVALPAPVRAGADVGLLVIAAVAYWQLDRQTTASGGGALSGDREGHLGIDPLLVVAPALALLAGTVLALRLLPPAARLAERWAAGGSGLTAALAGWQFSRRPLRGAGPVLLLVLAVAMGVLAIGQGASWERSQNDQADFRTGAAVRVLSSGSGDPADAGSYAALPGVRDAAPAQRVTIGLSGDHTATVLALDTAHADDGMLMRGDLTDGTPRELLAALKPPGATRPGILLPDGTRQLAVTLRITDTVADDGRSPSGSAPAVVLTLEDRYGFVYRMTAGEVPADARPHRVVLDLARATGGSEGAVAEPLTLTGFEVSGNRPIEGDEKHRLDVGPLMSLNAGGTARPVPLPAGFGWQAGLLSSSPGKDILGMPLEATATARTPLSVGYTTWNDPGADGNSQDFTVRVSTSRPPPPAVLPAVATDDFLRAAGARTGQNIDVTLGGDPVRVKIVKAVRQLPTTGAGVAPSTAGPTVQEGSSLLLDLETLNTLLAARHTSSLATTEWWLTTAPGKAGQVADALRARPDADPAQVLVRDETADELLSDPLGAGPRSALLAVAVAAAALAAAGFAVSVAGSLRERTAEFSVLRALGTPRRRLARLIAAEQGLLVVVALLIGLVLGVVLTRAVVPLVVLTGQATQPVPRVLVELPAGQVLLLLAGVAFLPVLIIAMNALRRTDPTVTLRQGDS